MQHAAICSAGFTRDLQSGRLEQHPALGSVVSLEWAADGRTLLYTTPNDLGRPSRQVMGRALRGSLECAWLHGMGILDAHQRGILLIELNQL